MGGHHAEYVVAIANAMHNVSSLLGRYECGFVDDSSYRRKYLQPFDETWRDGSGSAIQLESELDDTLAALRDQPHA